jgi:single-stranded-DNA-specific exonuclease
MPNCRVNAIYPLSNGKHTKLDITYGGSRYQALVFSKSPRDMFFDVGAFIDIAAHIDVNEYNGRESVSIKVADMLPHGTDTAKYLAAKDCFERFMNGEEFPVNFIRKMTPTRGELVQTYKLIGRFGEIGIDTLFMRINHPAINYCKLRLMVEAFCQVGIAEFIPSEQKVRIVSAKSKVDLQATEIMRRLSAAGK